MRYSIVLIISLLACTAASAQQFMPDNVFDSDINALFTSGGSTTPLFFLVKYSGIASAAFQNNCEFISASYALGNGLYLYAYEVNAAGLICTVTQFTVPLGGNPLVPSGVVTTGAFIAGDDPSVIQYYGHWWWFGALSVFNYYESFDFQFPIPDMITGAILSGSQSSPSGITFIAPGDPSLASAGLPQGVYTQSPVFGFITNVPPRIITGQFAFDSAGNPLPTPFQIVAPSGVTMLDPVPDLLNGQNPPATSISSNPDALATKGRIVQGAAADGVAEVVLRIAAGNPGDKYVLTLKNFVSSDEDGGVGDPLNPGVSGFTQPSVTVTAVNANTPQGPTPVAFAVYSAPLDFVRPSFAFQDASSDHRAETIQVQYTPVNSSTSITFTTSVTIVRPPVVLVHGLWGNGSAWDNFAPLYSSTGSDTRFKIARVDYSVPLASVLASTNPPSTNPAYSASQLALATTSALGFAFNAQYVRMQYSLILTKFAAGANPISQPVAAAQADFVTHSMGGDIVRWMRTLGPNFYMASNYGQGIVHKLVTIGTPHLGSPLATDLLSPQNSCFRGQLANKGLISFASVTLKNSTTWNGGVYDLQGDPASNSLGPTLSTLQQTPLSGPGFLMVAMISGVTTDLNGLNCSFPCTPSKLRIWCGGEPLATNLTSTGWPTVFSNAPNDAIVSEPSQRAGLSGVQELGMIHTDALARLGFTGIGELGPSSPIANDVIMLLNTPVSDLNSWHKFTP